MGSLRVRYDWASSLSLFTFVHWKRKWQPTPVFLPGESQGQGEPGGLLSMGLHRVGQDWRGLTAAAAATLYNNGSVSANVRLETRASINSKLHTRPSQDVWTGWEKSFIVYRMSWYCLYLTVRDWRICLGQGLPTGPACYKCLYPHMNHREHVFL